jgi:hypothetical protein
MSSVTRAATALSYWPNRSLATDKPEPENHGWNERGTLCI